MSGYCLAIRNVDQTDVDVIVRCDSFMDEWIHEVDFGICLMRSAISSACFEVPSIEVPSGQFIDTVNRLVVGRNPVAPNHSVQRKCHRESRQRNCNHDDAVVERPGEDAPVNSIDPTEEAGVLGGMLFLMDDARSLAVTCDS